jgi:hypothetical protein
MENETQTVNSAPAPAPTQALAKKAPVAIGNRGLQFSDLESLYRFGQCVAGSQLAPKGLEKVESIVVALQYGMELGLTPMQSLQNICVVNGRPSMFGDAQLAVIRGSGYMESIEEWFEQGGKKMTRDPQTFTDDTIAVCKVKRGGTVAEGTFSVADAKRANLWAKEGPWRGYPQRMLRFRARAFVLRDMFGDVLKGVSSAEEQLDIGSIPVETVTMKVEGAEVSTAAPVTIRAAGDATVATSATPSPSAPTPHIQLAGLLDESGHSFDLLMKWAEATGQTKDASCWPSLHEVPVALAAKWVKGWKNVLIGLNAGKEQLL